MTKQHSAQRSHHGNVSTLTTRTMMSLSLGLVLLCMSATLVSGQIIFDVQEEQPAPVLLGNIAYRANITSVPSLAFSLQGRRELFSLDANTGDFSTRTVLDRESLCGSVPQCVITTHVAVSSPPNFFQRYSVNVTVVDANDQRPDFGITSFPRSLSERAAINTTIQLPVANDADYEPLFKVQKYYLEPSAQDTFDLVVQRVDKSGEEEFNLYLRLRKKLDREVQDSYSLTLVASDGAIPNHDGRLPVVITVTDENDNAPVFSKPRYSTSIKEITQTGTVVLKVAARDDDAGENGRVGYEFPNDIGRRVLDFFTIDRVSGDIMLVKSLEKEGGKSFDFKVKAHDHGTPVQFSEVSVQIQVEDTVNDPPSISVSHFKSSGNSAAVAENAVVGTQVAFVEVEDTDSGNNGLTNCTASSEYFSMQQYSDSNSGEYTVSVAHKLDRETSPAHIITIQCMDRGSPPLSSTVRLRVQVEDVNDNPPIFTKQIYDMRVKENQEADKLVGNVFATDADEGVNADLQYAIDPKVTQFEINEANGYIYTAVKNLDREEQDTYRFEVYAYDTSSRPLSATAMVIVHIDDVNDMWPRFDNSSYHFRISENAELGTVLGRVHATDLDLGRGGMVEYLLVHSPLHPDPPFVLSHSEGTLTLTQKPDYEKEKHYNFVITAVDLGQPPRNSSVEVQIEVLDENDNPPIISFPSPDNLSVTLNLDVEPGHEVIKVIAHDADSGENGRLTYSLSSPNSSASSLFWINEDTGLVTLAVRLTPTDVRSYNIVISVNDNGAQQRATQALLQVEVVQQGSHRRPKESYTTIVIIMVCVTLFVAVIVLVTLCFIKYIDRRKYDSPKSAAAQKPTFEPVTKSADEYIHEGSGDDTLERGLVVSPSLQKQPPMSYQQQTGSATRNGKKSVTFDSAVRSSDTSMLSDSTNTTQPDSGFHSAGNNYLSSAPAYNTNLLTTFNPGSTDTYNSSKNLHRFAPASSSSPHSFNGPTLFYGDAGEGGRTNTGASGSGSLEAGTSTNSSGRVFEEQGEASDQVVDVALQKHNALVRSMRGNNRRPPYTTRQPRPGSGGHETDLCSSSSVETSDSGHGGSELDVSVIKVNV